MTGWEAIPLGPVGLRQAGREFAAERARQMASVPEVDQDEVARGDWPWRRSSVPWATTPMPFTKSCAA